MAQEGGAQASRALSALQKSPNCRSTSTALKFSTCRYCSLCLYDPYVPIQSLSISVSLNLLTDQIKTNQQEGYPLKEQEIEMDTLSRQ